MSVRGYADWKPKPEAVYWVNRTNEVLKQYEDYWPLSVRQIFYRLVADHEYPKSEAAYSKLTQMLSRARRAGYLPWKAIRDGGLGRTVAPSFFESGEDFEENVRRWASEMHLPRQRGQEAVIELWCEAGGMVPILEGIAEPYSCRVNTGGGYDSVTAKHNLALRVLRNAKEGKRTLILHVGDFDPSGEDMCAVLREDALHMAIRQVYTAALRATDGLGENSWPEWLDGAKGIDLRAGGQDAVRWVAGWFDVKRVALTGEQVIERQVETAPPKRTDSREAEFVERNAWVAEELGTEHITAQLEALTPPELTELLSDAIEAEMDMDVYRDVLAEEEEVRSDLLERLDRE